MDIPSLNRLLGNIDIYLLDQLLKGRFSKEMRILDAGCGEGRNAVYFIRDGYQLFGIDQNPLAIKMARMQASTIYPDYDVLRFQTADVEDIPFHQHAFDAVISSAVLHFAKNTAHFHQMVDEMMRVLKPNGMLFLRMATGFGGILDLSTSAGDGCYLLPDGSQRFVLTEKLLQEIQVKHHLSYLEPPKSVLLHGQRAMGVFVMVKASD